MKRNAADVAAAAAMKSLPMVSATLTPIIAHATFATSTVRYRAWLLAGLPNRMTAVAPVGVISQGMADE
jgi:hypothetical protein